jgi:multidrug efflux pump subunit AcrA (membrane-fusion protein)
MTNTLQARMPSHRVLLVTGLGGAGLAIALAISGLASRAHEAHANAQWSQVQSVPSVSLAKVENGQASRIDLPGTVQPFQKAQIYARVSGYLRSWQADIGTPVRAGQTLAMVDTPDLDQQLAQARGDLNVARANAKLAALTAQRWKALQTSGAVSQQVIDERPETATPRAPPSPPRWAACAASRRWPPTSGSPAPSPASSPRARPTLAR